MSAVQSPPAPAGRLQDIVVRCMDCGATYGGDQVLTACPACTGLLDVITPLDRAVTPADFTTEQPAPLSHSGVWRYRLLLPALPVADIVTRWEGNTPLYVDDRLTSYAGVTGGAVAFKHEGHNPTGSFKDRGMTVGVSHAKAVGAQIVACASTGNTSASLASYAASAGLTALVLIPEGKISGGKLAQTIAYGATVVQIEGDFDLALALLREMAADTANGIYLVNSVNPFRLEGQKTIIFEMLAQRGWRAPDVFVAPGGNLGNTAAFGKAITEAYEAGLIDRKPRLVVVQAAGSAPFASYYDSGFTSYVPVAAETVATAIKIGNPASTARAVRSIQQTNGLVTSVTDAEILDAKAAIDRAGIGCEPASAASLAGLRKLIAAGALAPDVDAVCLLTGNVLKDSEAIVNYHLGAESAAQPGANRPLRVAASVPALQEAIADALHR